MQRLRVAYNFGCRALCNLPWRASVSSHQVQCNIPTFEALFRKNTHLFLERYRKSNNIRLRALMQSDYLYSSLFFEHYNRILLCEWVIESDPSPGFSSRRGPKIRRGGTFFKYCIGCMQQPGSQTWNGGHRFQMEGPGTTDPPLATALDWTLQCLFDLWRVMSQCIRFLPRLDQFRNWRPTPQSCCNKCYVLTNISVKNVSVTLWFCLQCTCNNVPVTLWSRRLQCLVLRSVWSVFMNLRYAGCVCLYYGLRAWSQTNKLD